MTRRIIRHPLTLIALLASLALFLNACCGSCGDAAQEAAKEGIEKEIEKEKAKIDKENKEADLDIKKKAPKIEDEGGDEEEEAKIPPKKGGDDEGGDSGGGKLGATTVADIKPKELRERVEKLGWEVIGEPTEQNQTGMRGVTYPIVKGAKGGAVSIYEYKQKNVAKIFEDSMRKQKAATERDGGKVLTVLFPGDEATGKEVLDQILGR